MDGRSDGYALRTSEFEHRLYVLAEERCLDGEFVGQVRRDYACDTLEDMP